MIRWICTVILLLSGVSAYGQEPSARDSVYTALLGEEQALRARTDSLLSVIDRQREALRGDTTELRARSQAILRLEEEVFALRNQSGVVASKINAIEQERILNNLLRPAAGVALPKSATNEPELIDNAWFRENLSPEEYRQLREGKAGQPQIDRLVADYRSDYRTLERVAESYEQASDQPAADSLYALYRSAVSRIRQAESEFAERWGERYAEEVYLYSYLLDKLNRTAALSALNERNLARPVFEAGEVMSTAFAAWPGQRSLLLGYERALADALGLSAAADSLHGAEPVGLEDLAFPRIELIEKEFITYENISFPEFSPYQAEHSIPEFVVPDAGTCYSVTVGTFSQRQAVSIFRGAAPLFRLRAGTQWRYFAGLFRSYGDAAQAAQELAQAGFRRPEVVRWREGVYANLATEAAENEGAFRIEIQTAGELSDEIRGALARYARGKEITRVGNLFYVGTFSNRLQVDEVVELLKRLGAEISVIEN